MSGIRTPRLRIAYRDATVRQGMIAVAAVAAICLAHLALWLTS